MITCLRTAVAILIVSALATIARADTVLPELIGEWAGNGMVRTSLDDHSQPLRCRLTGKSGPDNETSLIGRCATAQRTLQIMLTIHPSQTLKEIAATATIGKISNPVGFVGSRTETGIKLRSQETFRRANRTLSSTFVLSVEYPRRISIREVTTDVDADQSFETLFLTLER